MNRPPFEISEELTTGKMPQQANPVGAAQSVSGTGNASDEPIVPLCVVRARVEANAILAALKQTGWNRKQAARLLKISYRGLLYKIHRHKLTAA